jgi:hypothetical protein
MKPGRAINVPALQPPDPALIQDADRVELLTAGEEVKRSMRALQRVGLNLVGELLQGQGAFIKLEHYPHNDVYDDATHSQYYYHAHRAETEEHGHFHTFLRAAGMSSHASPLDYPLASEPWPSGDQAISHLIAISMDAWGWPIGLFATNRWVTDETWYPAESVIEMLGCFSVDHAYPSWPVNRWVSGMLQLFRPHIQLLLRHRDAVVAAWQQADPERDVFEDRHLEVTGYLAVSVEGWLDQLTQTGACDLC